MDPAQIPLVIVEGERALLHVVEATLPAGELPARLSLYFESAPPGARSLVWLGSDGPRVLDPDRAIGEQVPPDAELEIRTG